MCFIMCFISRVYWEEISEIFVLSLFLVYTNQKQLICSQQGAAPNLRKKEKKTK